MANAQDPDVVREQDVGSRPADPAKFTAAVWHDELLPARKPGGMRVHRFVYGPGGHSHWHAHEGEQAVVVLSGEGRIKKEGKPGMVVTPGDVVYIAPGERHWHGATPGSVFVHLAFTATGATIWQEAVSEEDYLDRFP